VAADDAPGWQPGQLEGSEGDLEDYVGTVRTRPDREIRAQLRRLLVPSGTFTLLDELRVGDMRRQQRAGTLDPAVLEPEHSRRLIMHAAGTGPLPWEGITWILDCLPHRPADALTVISAFVFAHAQDLPDGALVRLHDAQAILRAYYIGLPGGQPERAGLLASLAPREFECLIWRLYTGMGYAAKLTPAQSDGGYDVAARRSDPARSEDLRIECKNWSKPVGVEIARRLLGVVSGANATKGVLVSAAAFTRGARMFADDNPRVELITGSQIVQLLNEHLGAHWPVHIDRLAGEPRTT
jgi:restriction system protein